MSWGILGFVPVPSPLIDGAPVSVKKNSDGVIMVLGHKICEGILVAVVKGVFDENRFSLPHHFLKGEIKFLQAEPIQPVFLLFIVKSEPIPFHFLQLIIGEHIQILDFVTDFFGSIAFSCSWSSGYNDKGIFML